MMGKRSLILPAWRPAGSHASRHAPWTYYVHRGRFKSLSAPETHGKQGTTLLDTLRSVDSIEEPATETTFEQVHCGNWAAAIAQEITSTGGNPARHDVFATDHECAQLMALRHQHVDGVIDAAVQDLRSHGVTDQLLRDHLSSSDGESTSGRLSGLLNSVVQRFLGTMAAAYLTCIILGVEEVHAAPKKRPAGTGPPPPATPPPVAAAAAPRQHTDRDGTPLQEVQTVPAYSGGIPMRGP